MATPLQQTTLIAQILGHQIATARKARHWTEADLAERCGVSAKTLRKVEDGDPSVKLATAIDAAVLVGVPLFSMEGPESLRRTLAREADREALLPSRVFRAPVEAKDNF